MPRIAKRTDVKPEQTKQSQPTEQTPQPQTPLQSADIITQRAEPTQVSGVNAIDMLRLETLTSFEKYTKMMFKAQYKRSFIVAEHHKRIFKALQDVVDGKITRLIINIAPRYGKTELVIKSFISWCFALNPKCKFLHLSYSDMLVNDNSETVRNIMSEELYKTLYPQSSLASEKGSAKRWKTKAGGELYAVSTQGQVTGFGAGSVDNDVQEMDGGNDVFVFDDHTNEMLQMIGATQNVFQGAIMIDDPLKADDAVSDLIRERINQRFENTIRNRVNSRKTPIIIIMQRLHEHDLCGYLQEIEPDVWTVLSLPVIQTTAEGEEYALWPLKHSLQELHKLREINPVVFETQYMQNPMPSEGLMYHEFKTYTSFEVPSGSRATQRWCYVDTADTGADYLCAICFINTPEQIYVTDILYTQLPMERTEVMLAKMLTENSISECLIESNNGGRQFARNVKRLVRVDMRNYKTVINTFTQTKNKASRIFSNSALVNSDVSFPEGWERRYKEFYNAISTYRKDNKRKSIHDDAPDALTGVVEMRSRKIGKKKIMLKN